jgi:arsenate reductase
VNVLFVCVRNAGRSQMAEALFEREAGGAHAARSAGSEPAERVHPEVVASLAELGIDVSRRVPRALDEDDVRWADTVVTMGCGDACAVLPGKRYVEWDLRDPANLPVEEVREIRDEIGARVGTLVAELSGK